MLSKHRLRPEKTSKRTLSLRPRSTGLKWIQKLTRIQILRKNCRKRRNASNGLSFTAKNLNLLLTKKNMIEFSLSFSKAMLTSNSPQLTWKNSSRSKMRRSSRTRKTDDPLKDNLKRSENSLVRSFRNMSIPSRVTIESMTWNSNLINSANTSKLFLITKSSWLTVETHRNWRPTSRRSGKPLQKRPNSKNKRRKRNS